MHFLSTLTLIVAEISAVSSVCLGGHKDFDPWECIDLGKDAQGQPCQYQLQQDPFAIWCSCDNNPSNNPDLAWFYTGANFTFFEYRGFAPYGQCTNLPSFYDKNVLSMQTNTAPPTVCCVYTATNCDTSLGQASAQIDAGEVALFQGLFENGVRSYRCSPWVNDQSKCTDGPYATKRGELE